MSKRKPNQRRMAVPERGAAFRHPPRNPCKALVRLDTARVRARLLKDRAKAEKALSKAEAEWRQHVEVDQPAYRRWAHAVGGPLRSDVERMQGELGQLRYLMGAIGRICELWDLRIDQYLGTFVGYVRMTTQASVADLAKLSVADWLPHLQAFLEQESERLRKQMEEESAADDADRIADEDDPDEDHDGEDDCATDDELDDVFGPMDDDQRDCLRDLLGLLSPAHREPSRSVRDLYRELCRRLHPDAVGDMTTRRRALWDQVQEAYAERDAQTLEALLARVELEVEPAAAAHAAPSRLLALIQHLKSGLRSVQSLIRRGKRELAWGFSAWTETRRNRVRDAILEQLDEERFAVQEELADFQREFRRQVGKALRSQQPRRRATPPSPRTGAGQMFLDFQ
jgi:hypothetical protein